ncbi:MAG: hypothetical protein ACI8UC_000827, partial [Psychromonas sp.]
LMISLIMAYKSLCQRIFEQEHIQRKWLGLALWRLRQPNVSQFSVLVIIRPIRNTEARILTSGQPYLGVDRLECITQLIKK